MHSQGMPRELGHGGQALPKRPLAGKTPLDVQQGIELGPAAP